MTDTVAAIRHTQHLLAQEEAEERRQYQERVQLTPLPERVRLGTCFYPAQLDSEDIGPGEVPVLHLKLTRQGNLRRSLFQPGAVVAVFANDTSAKRPPSTHGVVMALGNDTLRVALHAEDTPDWLYDGHPIGVDPFYDDRSYRDMEAALEAVARADGDRLAHLREVLLGDRPATFKPVASESAGLTHLNASQQAAVQFALAAREVAFLHGPPGTGKTTTLVAAIQAAVRAEGQVLACAPSNTAVDWLGEKLAAAGLSVVRLGHPVRVSPTAQALTLEHQLNRHPQSADLKALHKRREQVHAQALKYRRSFGPQERHERHARLQEARALKRDAERLERYILQDVLTRSQVVLCTLTGAASSFLRDLHWNTVFIDEAAQALEPACWIALRKAERVIFAGDPFQLPPTVKSLPAAEAGLMLSLAEKALLRQTTLGVDISRMLQVQYRMHAAIMDFSNRMFYGGNLIADASVAQRELPWGGPMAPVRFVDTAGTGFDEETNPQTLSTSNPGEADLLLRLVADELAPHWTHSAFGNLRIGIVAPYSEQVALLRQRAAEHPLLGQLAPEQLAIRTIDGFQGQERDIIAISLVRSNSEAFIGFLSDTRRMNVALTRAKAALLIVGDSATLGSHPFYAQLVEHLQATCGYHSAWEWL